MPSGPQRERIAAVFSGGRQGSGYLLNAHLVLTADHVVADPDDIRVITLGGRGEVRCRRVWSGREEITDKDLNVDIALLLAEGDITLFPADTTSEHYWGNLTSLTPVRGCEAFGFPLVQRDAAGRLESEQLTGTLKPGAGLLSGNHALTLDDTPPAPRPDGASPWAGVSGAPVFRRDTLLGIVSGDPYGWQHGRLTVVPVAGLLDRQTFTDALGSSGGSFSVTSGPLPIDEDDTFETRYARFLAERHSRLTIFGIDLSSRSRASWPLDAAYVSLETTSPERHTHEDGIPAPSGPRPADQALAGHDRVLLRGVAGSGKTTLVQWLTVSALRDDGPGRIPFVLPLRTLIHRDALPLPADFLAAVRAPISPPPGWAERVLTAGRGLLLVDGIDEIGEREREQVRDWLRDLLIAFPGNQWMVTSRPSAVEESWLAREGFTDLTLAPMSRPGVTAFVDRWHDAARATETDDEELARLDVYQGSLHEAIRTKQDLARLATNPLMCGLICALHRDRHGYLPHGRRELYEAALSMLLTRRDRERDLTVQLTEEPQIQLLQKLAYWMIRNGQAEMDQSDAISLIEAALPSMPAVAELGDARQIFRHLLERSGLLREPAEGTVDFIHRTFQDYLGAKAAVEERDFDLMVRNAHHDQWSDVIRMATAHARPAERARLLRKLIARGDRTQSHRSRLHLLAMACLEHAPELDPAVRAEVNARTAALIPPRTDGEAAALAAIGPVVLELLPGPDGLEDDEARAVVWTALAIGTDAAIPLLARFRHHKDPLVRSPLASRWRIVDDPERYAAEVLTHLPRSGTLYFANTRDDLRTLGRMGGVEQLCVSGPLRKDDLTAHLEPGIVSYLALSRDFLMDGLGFLSAFPRLNFLQLSRSSPLTDLSPLGSLPLSDFALFGPSCFDLASLATSTRLESLALGYGVLRGEIRSLPRTLPLKKLELIGMDARLTGIGEFPALRHLGLAARESLPLPEEWDHLTAHPGLRSLTFAFNDQGERLPRGLEMPGIESLEVSGSYVATRWEDIVRCFPSIRELRIHDTPADHCTIDLAPLAELPHLTTVHVSNATAILNADRLPTAKVTARPRPRDWGTARV
ncbi:NACHT domain-containing protein [Streptomyces sp. H10-C2]|uniref:serine protease n=1 Tax=unclassified Streptomyces TaxID=2593676 RepID=UPI0024B8A6C8|nr:MULTISPECIES: serine protease [unclassified Streptomyces]MDJ0345325.1 NACHT domain-containing protein [Streptomyces sp. PH10-H1]MDJ0374236.1 NACHT domain-containing protein [Streptomyces sp. H10-C2]